MSIGIITGATGASKTSNAVYKEIYPAWKKGTNIYTNTLLFFEDKINRINSNIIDNPEKFSRLENLLYRFKCWLYPKFDKWFNIGSGEYDPQELNFWKRNKELIKDWLFDLLTIPYARGNIIYFSDISEILGISNGLIFIDEGSAVMDARNWESLPEEFSNELRQSRKNGLDLIVTTQEFGQIDKNYRRLVHWWKECEPTFFKLGADPCILGRFRAKYHNPFDYLGKSETAQIDEYKIPTIKKQGHWITIFKRRKYDTNYNVGFHSLKIVKLIDLKGFKKTNIWAIIPKKMTYSQLKMDLRDFHKEKLTKR